METDVCVIGYSTSQHHYISFIKSVSVDSEEKSNFWRKIVKYVLCIFLKLLFKPGFILQKDMLILHRKIYAAKNWKVNVFNF